MQSINPSTLREIKRTNISLDAYTKVQSEIQSRGLRSMADVILGLPLETKESHFDAVYSLIDSGIQEFTSYQAMVLKSTELEEDITSEKFGLVVKSRLLPRAIGKYKINNISIYVAEVESIIVATDTLSFEDYLNSRILHFLTMVYHNSGVFEIIDFILEKYNIKKSIFISVLYQRVENKSSSILMMIEAFVKETMGELFDSEDECADYYCNESNLIKVKEAEVGANLLWKYVGISFFEYWSEVVNEVIISISTLLHLDDDTLYDIRTYLLARIINISDHDMKQTVQVILKTKLLPEYFGVDNRDNFFAMKLSNNSFNSISHYRDIYANNPSGWSLMLAQLRVHSFVRSLSVC